MRPPFPKAIDSTLRSTFVSCPRKFELMYLNHWKPQAESVHLVAGGAFAKGLEVARHAFWTHGEKPQDAIAHGVHALIEEYGDYEPSTKHENKDVWNLVKALDAYFTNYGFETDPIQPALIGGKRAIEFTFALPISLDLRHPETGDPILYTGRFDMLGDYMGSRWAVDEKTTAYLGKSWYANWKLRSQFTGYVWASQESGEAVEGAIVRGIALRKTGFDFAESIQHRPRWFLDLWHAQLIRDVRRMIDCWESGFFDYALDNACTDYGGCTFQDICTSMHPDRWLKANFVQRIWDPLAREERDLKEGEGK